MRVKRFVVDSMPDALQRIRVELGNDAVILNTKEIKIGGFLGLFGKKRIEVIAATDTSTAVSKQAQGPPTVKLEHAPAPIAVPTAVAVIEPVEPISAAPAIERIERPLSNPINKDEDLLKEVRQMKEMILRFSNLNGTEGILPEGFRTIEQRLLEQDIQPNIIAKIFGQIIEEDAGATTDWTEAHVQSLVKEQLLQILKHDSIKTLHSETKIVHFVGPTGVGKTTTIAKLAAEQVLKYNRKVGFITSDTYRIAAIEQLKVYANILNVPLEVVFSPREMSKAFRTFADKDLIFMDTAGRNYRNELYVSELIALLRDSGQSETYLVLSLTSKYQDMKVIAENFVKFNVDKVLYTKMDETGTYGAIVNLAHDFNLHGSYITNGQNVPDDIEVMKDERIVDLIIGGKKDE